MSCNLPPVAYDLLKDRYIFKNKEEVSLDGIKIENIDAANSIFIYDNNPLHFFRIVHENTVLFFNKQRIGLHKHSIVCSKPDYGVSGDKIFFLRPKFQKMILKEAL